MNREPNPYIAPHHHDAEPAPESNPWWKTPSGCVGGAMILTGGVIFLGGGLLAARGDSLSEVFALMGIVAGFFLVVLGVVVLGVGMLAR